jgi:CO/xanthine dehydrogenase Mo-binding subunit
MNYLAGAALAAALCASQAASAETLLFNDFQNNMTGAWIAENDHYFGTSTYQGNISLKLNAGASVTDTISLTGYEGISIAASFAAYAMDAHGACFAEVSVDGGDNWIKILRVGRGQDDGYVMHEGKIDVPEADNQPKVILRLHNSGTGGATCWADNITVTGTAIAPKPAAPPG